MIVRRSHPLTHLHRLERRAARGWSRMHGRLQVRQWTMPFTARVSEATPRSVRTTTKGADSNDH